MKSLIKAVFTSLICISMILSSSSKVICCDDRQPRIMESNSCISEVCVEQKEAIKAYFTLRQHFQLDDKGNIARYPDNYGGTYINSENELVLRVTTCDEWVNGIQESISLKNEKITIEPCKASLNDVVAEYLAIKNELPREIINSSYYSASMNSYVLRCFAENEESILSALKRNNASDNIVIQIDEEVYYSNLLDRSSPPLRTSYLYGGTLLYYGQTAIGTLGISGSLGNYNHCYLTAGHVAYNRSIGPSTGSSYQYSPVLCEYENGGTGDYAVVPAPSSYLKSNQIYTSNSLGRTAVTKYYNSYDYPEGAVVYKFGQATLVTYGTVCGSYYSGYMDTMNSYYELNGMIVVDHLSHPYISAPGDSGGPCWVINDDDELVLLGTVSGGTYSTGQTVYQVTMYVSPICYAVSDGFVPYNMTSVTSID